VSELQDVGYNAPSTSDGDLVRATIQGDRRAFDVLVRRHQRLASQVAFRLVGNSDDADEIAQEAFCRAFTKLKSLTQPQRFGGWLLRIVSNQALNFRRGRALRQTFRLADMGGSEDPERAEVSLPDKRAQGPDEVLAGREMADRIGEVLAGLPEKQRLSLVLFSMEKLPQKEIAEMLEISVEAVKWHVFAARKKLKQELKEYL
jgi:RNA polymerase sigma-70 factor (ECF subfamily)